ncbi:MAG TPA: YggT family protein [Pseudonocardiaceae bacterium]|nr:YggT family protein [Pseudonocardiaceae bacterium]
MDLIGTVIGYVLTLFIVVLIVRAVLGWAAMVTVGSGWMRRAHALTHSVTEPVIAPVRRVLPPVRTGGLSIDLAFTVIFIVALILRSVAFSL